MWLRGMKRVIFALQYFWDRAMELDHITGQRCSATSLYNKWRYDTVAGCGWVSSRDRVPVIGQHMVGQ